MSAPVKKPDANSTTAILYARMDAIVAGLCPDCGMRFISEEDINRIKTAVKENGESYPNAVDARLWVEVGATDPLRGITYNFYGDCGHRLYSKQIIGDRPLGLYRKSL